MDSTELSVHLFVRHFAEWFPHRLTDLSNLGVVEEPQFFIYFNDSLFGPYWLLETLQNSKREMPAMLLVKRLL
jgi:hypothetical protein